MNSRPDLLECGDSSPLLAGEKRQYIDALPPIKSGDESPHSKKPESSSGRLPQLTLALGLVLLLGVSILFRVLALDRYPGINGDEAWYGVQVKEFLTGGHYLLKTPSGLVLNPAYSGLLLILQAIWPAPSFWILRLPALLSGLLLVGLTYPLIRRTLGPTIALVCTLLVASLPILIAFSRFGWDLSQSGLITLVCLYFLLRRNWLGLCLAGMVALLVHPVHLFLAPLFLGPEAATWMAAFLRRPAAEKRKVLLLALALAVLGALGLGLGLYLAPGKLGPLIHHGWERLTDLAGWRFWFVLFGRFLSGITVYRYITGPLPETTVLLHDAVFWTLSLSLLAGGGWVLVRQKRWRDLGIIGGTGASLLALYLVAGPVALLPDFERYAMFLAVPSCLCLAILVDALAVTRAARRILQSAALLTACLLLVSFGEHYFRPLQETGGRSHPAFRTGRVEPKQAAFDTIRAHIPPGASVRIMAEDWWTYWPIRYLAAGHPEIQVVSLENPCPLDDELARPGSDFRFVVGFAGGPLEDACKDKATVLQRWTIRDNAGSPVLFVWELAP
ncbi:MAG: hypothetical protein JO112_06505 [Planctomycetes bacterium]|nr:hypothetical protein [Planctomycetota bacterium]